MTGSARRPLRKAAPALPAPTPEERARARAAALALRAALADPSSMGARTAVHVDLSRPRRAEWLTTWANLPGLVRGGAGTYTHALLPGWQYARHEVGAEMIPDLEALAEHGLRPTGSTTGAATRPAGEGLPLFPNLGGA